MVLPSRPLGGVDALLPTVVLCGSPNVGKSSLVRAVSSGKPEVQNYPFTTRSTSVGHIADDIIGYPVCQVMDTPGLLARSQEEFNAMEKMTLASILHLPSIVIFVLDLTGLAGRQSSVGSQLQVMEYLRQEFPEREWLYIITKTDLP
ncbi:P-loop containing nucleoside triphosphate hydrolase protein, partial [Baffinella frigidus]